MLTCLFDLRTWASKIPSPSGRPATSMAQLASEATDTMEGVEPSGADIEAEVERLAGAAAYSEALRVVREAARGRSAASSGRR